MWGRCRSTCGPGWCATSASRCTPPPPDLQVAERTLEGVIEALERKKITWTMETNMSEFRLQVALASPLTSPDLTNLH